MVYLCNAESILYSGILLSGVKHMFIMSAIVSPYGGLACIFMDAWNSVWAACRVVARYLFLFFLVGAIEERIHHVHSVLVCSR